MCQLWEMSCANTLGRKISYLKTLLENLRVLKILHFHPWEEFGAGTKCLRFSLDEADDDDDPEYNFLEDLDEPDTEDFRTDRAVRITSESVDEHSCSSLPHVYLCLLCRIWRVKFAAHSGRDI